MIPLAAWWLNISLWQAFVLDIALVLFYLPYAFFYNLAYDKSCSRVISRAPANDPKPGFLAAYPASARCWRVCAVVLRL